jgi:proline iminopeptidase
VPVFESHDGVELHYDVLGQSSSREPIVVLAGGAARHPAYLGDLAGLDSVRTLLILHQRGVGRSAAAGPLASWVELAHDVTALRRHLGLGRIDVLAHSAGTRVALAYAAAHPTEIQRLCLVAPPATWLVDATDDREALIERRRGEPWFDDYEKARPALEAAATIEEYRPLARLEAPLAWARWDERAQAHDAIGDQFEAAAAAFFSPPPDRRRTGELAAELARVTAPVLVVAGSADAVTGLEPVLALADLFPAGSAVVIPAAGHYPWVEQPTAFRRAVDAFFTGDPPRKD